MVTTPNNKLSIDRIIDDDIHKVRDICGFICKTIGIQFVI